MCGSISVGMCGRGFEMVGVSVGRTASGGFQALHWRMPSYVEVLVLLLRLLRVLRFGSVLRNDIGGLRVVVVEF